MRPSLLILIPLLSGSVLSLEAIEYEQDIFPIFERKCANCHIDGSSKGGVGLDVDKVGREIGAGKAIVPGSPDESDLFEVVTLPEDDNDIMPPQGKGRPLSATEVAKLKEWIEAGAIVGNEEPEMTKAAPEEKPQRPSPIEGSWTNTDGKTIEATLLRVEGDKAILRMGTRDYPYPIENLDAAAQATIRTFAEQWEKASSP